MWSIEQANRWYAARPWLVGCNFIPSTAANQLEMWQAESFDPATIARELGWAHDLGLNTVRVFLHNLLWQHDAPGFKRRIERYLELAAAAGICTLFVLFDDCWNDDPALGPQPAPIPGVHNSRWLRSPGSRLVEDPAAWPVLEAYVKDILGAFGRDGRVLMWDLYNEPGNAGGVKTLPLLRATFDWARAANPSQPLTAGIWSDGQMNDLQLGASDVITFHNYLDVANLRDQIAALRAYGRPLICTEYMARTFAGSRFETHLPVFTQERVGCYNWGLVTGKTQTCYPWGSPPGAPEPETWFHDILRPDGTPFDVRETDLIKSLALPAARTAADKQKIGGPPR